MMKLVILALAFALAAVAAFPTDAIVSETLPAARRQPAQALFDVGQHGRHTHRLGNQLSTMLRQGDSMDKCEQVVNDEMQVMKDSMETDKTFLKQTVGKIEECLTVFNTRFSEFKEKKRNFEDAMVKVANGEEAVKASTDKLTDEVKDANDRVTEMNKLAEHFKAPVISEPFENPPSDSARGEAGKNLGEKFFDTVLAKLYSDLQDCQETQVCQIVKLKTEIEGPADAKRKTREGAIVHGSYLKCALKDGGKLAALTTPKKCEGCYNNAAGICRGEDGDCSPGDTPTPSNSVGWQFAQPNTKVCSAGKTACHEFLDNCAYTSYTSKMQTGLYSVGWTNVTVNKVDLKTGAVTEKSQSVDDWGADKADLDCSQLELTHTAKANVYETADALHKELASDTPPVDPAAHNA